MDAHGNRSQPRRLFSCLSEQTSGSFFSVEVHGPPGCSSLGSFNFMPRRIQGKERLSYSVNHISVIQPLSLPETKNNLFGNGTRMRIYPPTPSARITSSDP